MSTGTNVQWRETGAKMVGNIELLEDHSGQTVSLNGSSTLAALGITLHEDVKAITLNPAGAIYYSTLAGTCGTSHFPIATNQGYTIYGDRVKLTHVRLYAAAATNVGIVQHILKQLVPITTTTTTTSTSTTTTTTTSTTTTTTTTTSTTTTTTTTTTT